MEQQTNCSNELQKTEKGQSLVEMAFITPILLIMFIGVIEIGWALRGYLVMVNINREVARRSVRQGYLDFSQRSVNPDVDRLNIGYADNLMGYFSTGYSNDSDTRLILPLLDSFDESNEELQGYMSATHFVAHTGQPCGENGSIDCCDQVDDAYLSLPNYSLDDPDHPYEKSYFGIQGNFRYDDIILHPDMEHYEQFFFTSRELTENENDATPSTRIANYRNFAYKLAIENMKFNCDLMAKGGGILPSNNNVIVTELYYRQPHLLSFPGLSVERSSPLTNLGVPVTNPIPLYSQTTMRLIASARETGTSSTSTVGAFCSALPIVASTELRNLSPDYDPINNSYNAQKVNNIFDGWIKWSEPPAGMSDLDYLRYELTYPQMALNQYGDGLNVLDAVSKTDSVNSLNVTELNDTVRTQLVSWGGQQVIIPIVTNSIFSGAAVVQMTEFEYEGDVLTRIGGVFLRRAEAECLDIGS